MNDKKQRRDFTDEFKNDAFKLVNEQGCSAAEAGRRLGIHHSNVSRWGREQRRLLETPAKTSRPRTKGSGQKINAFRWSVTS